MNSATALQRVRRIPGKANALMVPRPIAPGRFEVDATWGVVQPMVLAPGVRTVGELEVIKQIERGLALIDTRRAVYLASGTIPTARSIVHTEITARIKELDPGSVTVFFCNGPQCTATPDAIRRLLGAGYPPQGILYYRGGIHDWVTLGYPLELV